MIGGLHWGEPDVNESIRTIHAALDAEINLIDSAPVYGFGHCEQVVGRAIHDRRDHVVLVTKNGEAIATGTLGPTLENRA